MIKWFAWNLTAFNRFKFYRSKRSGPTDADSLYVCRRRRRQPCFCGFSRGRDEKCDIIFSIVLRLFLPAARGRATYRIALLNVNDARPPSIIILSSLFLSGRPRRTLNSSAQIESRLDFHEMSKERRDARRWIAPIVRPISLTIFMNEFVIIIIIM